MSSASLVNSGGAPLLSESYQYDVLGNIAQRSAYWDVAGAQFTETFEYDKLNRLKTSTIGSVVSSLDYDAIGNIKNKTGVGTGDYVYGTRPHAVSSISGIGSFNYDDNGNLLDGAGREAKWTSFDMPQSIKKGTESSTFLYGPEHQRVRQDRTDASKVPYTVYYAGSIEVEVSGGKTVVKTYWPNGLGVELDNGTDSQLRWTHQDRQGSVIAITDENGGVKERMAYDSWGKRRNLNDPGTPDSIDGGVDNKGYTGHEMLDKLDLVHMNGRVYDPLVARFMSADPYVQDVEHSQSYNRYSYVWNNPTNLTDPTGFMAQGFANGDMDSSSPSGELPSRHRGSTESVPSRSADRSDLTMYAAGTATVNVTGRRPNAAFEKWALGMRLKAMGYGQRVYAARRVIIPAARVAAIRVAPRVLAAQAADATVVGAAIGAAGAAWGLWEIGSSVYHAVDNATDPEDALSSPDTKSGEGAKDGKKDTLQPGPHAGESIPARGPGRDFSKDERDKINEIGQNTGCHTCGSKDPGTTSGNHIPDHQPPNALNPSGGAQELYPHCLTCSRVQGGQVRGTQSR